jgi:hypothetical protein
MLKKVSSLLGVAKEYKLPNWDVEIMEDLMIPLG